MAKAKFNPAEFPMDTALVAGATRLYEAHQALAAFTEILAQSEREISIEPRKLYFLLRPIVLELDAAHDELRPLLEKVSGWQRDLKSAAGIEAGPGGNHG